MSAVLGDLRVQKIRKQMKDFILEADFTIQVGERAALLGQSGSGKTTLLRLLAGFESLHTPGDSGNVFLGSQEFTRLPVQKREIGFIFQDQALFLGLNVLDNVTFALRMRGISKKEREATGLSWLSKVGLQSKLNSSVMELSGGERQRVAFVRALIWQPRLLLLDEPFSALDRNLRNILRKELVSLHELWPAPLLLVTHDEDDMDAVATTRLELKGYESLEVSQQIRQVKKLV